MAVDLLLLRLVKALNNERFAEILYIANDDMKIEWNICLARPDFLK